MGLFDFEFCQVHAVLSKNSAGQKGQCLSPVTVRTFSFCSLMVWICLYYMWGGVLWFLFFFFCKKQPFSPNCQHSLPLMTSFPIRHLTHARVSGGRGDG